MDRLDPRHHARDAGPADSTAARARSPAARPPALRPVELPGRGRGGRRRPGRLQGRGHRRRHRQDRQRQPRGGRQLPGGRHRAVDLRQEGHAAGRHRQPRRPRRAEGLRRPEQGPDQGRARVRRDQPRRPGVPGQARRLLRRHVLGAPAGYRRGNGRTCTDGRWGMRPHRPLPCERGRHRDQSPDPASPPCSTSATSADIRGHDGRTVRWGRLYRSDSLHRIDERRPGRRSPPSASGPSSTCAARPRWSATAGCPRYDGLAYRHIHPEHARLGARPVRRRRRAWPATSPTGTPTWPRPAPPGWPRRSG